MDGIDFQLVREGCSSHGYAHCLVFLSVRSLSMISFSVVVTASLSESECKGRDFWDSGKIFRRFFSAFRGISMNQDRFWAVCFGFMGIHGDLGRFGGEGNLGVRGMGTRG